MKTILLVSSSSAFLDRNETLLRRADFTIISATDSAAALATMRVHSVDLVLIDIHLDDLSGEEFVGHVLRAGLSYKPSLILVCNDNNEEFERIKGCGADALLGRPVKPLQLIKTVGQFLTVTLVRSRRVSLRVRVISKKDEVEFFCISHNISLTGMLIETEYSLDIADLIACWFNIPGAADVQAEGEIVRTARSLDGGYLYGIHFTSISRQARRDLDQYIAAVVRGEQSS
jgi:CheY-like chemotaxis protein